MDKWKIIDECMDVAKYSTKAYPTLAASVLCLATPLRAGAI